MTDEKKFAEISKKFAKLGARAKKCADKGEGKKAKQGAAVAKALESDIDKATKLIKKALE